jgi:hypothetical protein
MDIMDIELLKDALKSASVIVEFTKANGEFRRMKCTRRLDMIPKEFHPKSEEYNRGPDYQIRVFDIEKNGWRSFNSNSILNWKYE